jgi:hypothetical protein
MQNSRRISLLVSVFMVLILVTVMSFTMLTIAEGWTDDFSLKFAKSWVIGVIVALPTVLLVNPIVVRLVRRICKA